MARKRVLVACGTSIATATHAANTVMDIAKEAGFEVDVAQCKSAEIKFKMQTFPPDLVIAMTPVPPDLGVPVLNGVPFISGVGLDQLKAQVIEILQGSD
ncbi:MAG: PTS galactitol transporter subunit IIB [Anaerolineales bacterium]|nr:PTS galactitol transporter subunit IIB [Anaerolineales bacterium]